MCKDELDINQFPRGIVSPMAAFEIAVIEWSESTKTEHFWKKLRIARQEFAERLEDYAQERVIEEFKDISIADAAYQIEQRLTELQEASKK